MTSSRPDALRIAGRLLQSRLLIGTGKYKDLDETRRAVRPAAPEIVTVAVRRTNISQKPGEPNLFEVLPPERYTILPNTAGCYTSGGLQILASDPRLLESQFRKPVVRLGAERGLSASNEESRCHESYEETDR